MSAPDHFDRAAAVASTSTAGSRGSYLYRASIRLGAIELIGPPTDDKQSADHDLCDVLNSLRGEFDAVATEERARIARALTDAGHVEAAEAVRGMAQPNKETT